MAGKAVKNVQEVSYHRNGICGNGFYAIRFQSDIEGYDGKWGGKPHPERKDANFLGIVFDEPGSCAITCLDLIPEVGVKFAAGNSWRGDHYEPELREAIKTHESSGSVRVGPFAIPVE